MKKIYIRTTEAGTVHSPKGRAGEKGEEDNFLMVTHSQLLEDTLCFYDKKGKIEGGVEFMSIFQPINMYF